MKIMCDLLLRPSVSSLTIIHLLRWPGLSQFNFSRSVQVLLHPFLDPRTPLAVLDTMLYGSGTIGGTVILNAARLNVSVAGPAPVRVLQDLTVAGSVLTFLDVGPAAVPLSVGGTLSIQVWPRFPFPHCWQE